jgi:hypothetical protein
LRESQIETLGNTVDLTRKWGLPIQKGQTNRRIYWDFHRMRIRPTHYTIWKSCSLRSWLLDGSRDGKHWIEIDRQSSEGDLPLNSKGSFPVCGSPECHFFRLTFTDKDTENVIDLDMPYDMIGPQLIAVEFFGILLR